MFFSSHSKYDYQDGREKTQGVLGKIKALNLGEGRGLELLEELYNGN